MPCPAESMLPTITWSTWSPSIPARERTSLPTVAPRSVAGVSFSEPPKVPMPVLRGVEMTISPFPLPLPKLTLYSFRLRLARGYIKRQGPDRTTQTSLYGLSVYISTHRYPIQGPRNISERADPKVRPKSFYPDATPYLVASRLSL